MAWYVFDMSQALVSFFFCFFLYFTNFFTYRLPLWCHSNPMTSKKGLEPWWIFFFVSFFFINTILLRTNTRPLHHKHDQTKKKRKERKEKKRKRKENCPRDVNIDISWAVGHYYYSGMLVGAIICFFMLFVCLYAFCALSYK